ncbi:hypothetical protein [Sediminicola sp. 1XM1-17]|uniref:hypothetical protein n=1 Tax=Sediminicola sp. 1XM1-17 TaxID=3127702 RepID=UPI00307757D6
MNKRIKDSEKKKKSKQPGDCADQSNKTNTIHSQNEEIKKGNVETGERDKESQESSK